MISRSRRANYAFMRDPLSSDSETIYLIAHVQGRDRMLVRDYVTSRVSRRDASRRTLSDSLI